jgi:hypothetical protein
MIREIDLRAVRLPPVLTYVPEVLLRERQA